MTLAPDFRRDNGKSAPRQLCRLAFSAVALLVCQARAGVALFPYGGTLNLPSPAQPRFTIVANLPNPSTATDYYGLSRTDSIARIEIYNAAYGWFSPINASDYNSLWSDPRGNLGSSTQTYLVTAMGNHWETYSNWVDGHWEDNSHWAEECHDEEEGYWDELGNWVVTGTHESCSTNWIDDIYWIDAHWEYGLSASWVSFGSSEITFYLSGLQGATALTAFNNTTNLASPAQPKFTIATSITNPRTVTDVNGNARTDIISDIEIYNSSYGWFPTINVNASNYSALWTDPRANLSASNQTYTVYVWGLRWNPYDNGWVAGHWEDEGHYGEDCHEEDEGYWDDYGNWVSIGSHVVCETVWIVDYTYWVDGYRDAGFTTTLELMSRTDITFIITTGVPQTITFPVVGRHSHGEPAFALNATASSGLPVAYAVMAGPATVSGNMVSLTGTGPVTIVASQEGNSTYSAAPDVSQTFNVVAGQIQTVSFAPIANRTWGDPPFAVSATSSSGLPVSLAVTGGSATISGGTVTITGGGTATITATQSGNATYGPATPVSRSFDVAKVGQTITFDPLPDRVDGDPSFPVSATATSYLPVLFSVVSGPATVSGNSVTIVGPGTIIIRASQGGNSNYLAASPVDRAFYAALGPNGHALTVENGTASAIGGNQGAVVSIHAVIPIGRYFTGWAHLSGSGWIHDAASPDTSFTMQSSPATVRATYSDTVPTYNIEWTQINMPSYITRADNTLNSTVPTSFDITVMVRNNGTALWPFGTRIRASDPYNANTPPWGEMPVIPTSLIANQTASVKISLSIPSSQASPTIRLEALRYDWDSRSWERIGDTSGNRSVMFLFRTNVDTPRIYWYENSTVGSPIVGVPYSGLPIFDPNVGTRPTSYTAVGTFPPGITLNSTTGALGGTPTAAGRYAVTVAHKYTYVDSSNGRYDLYGAVGAEFNIEPTGDCSLSVINGTASASTVLVGQRATIVANAPPTGQIFNGWSVTSGAATFGDSHSTTTSIQPAAIGDVLVRADYVPGNPLTVINGSSTPMGGVVGAQLTLSANPDANGTMFGRWSMSGPGAIASPSLQTSQFTMGAAAATVTANFVPGYRLSVMGGGQSASGGVPGSYVNIWPGTSPGPGFTNIGFWLEGPGYFFGTGSLFVVGKGPTGAHVAWWSPSRGEFPVSRLWPTNGTGGEDYYTIRLRNEPFGITAATSFSGQLIAQNLDYSTDGGNAWVPIAQWIGTPPRPPLGGGYENWRLHYDFPTGIATAGVVVFRGRGRSAALDNPVYFYYPLTILNQSAATFTSHPASLTVGPGGQAKFSFKAIGNGGVGSFDFQWRKGTTVLKAGTTDTGDELIINNVDEADAGTYSAYIRSGVVGDWLPSQPATLTVGRCRPQITGQPASHTVPVGARTAFEVGVMAYPEPTYQWYKDHVEIIGETSSVLNFTSVTLGSDGTYYVVVSNAEGATISSSAKLTVTSGGADGIGLRVHRPSMR